MCADGSVYLSGNSQQGISSVSGNTSNNTSTNGQQGSSNVPGNSSYGTNSF